MVPSQCRVCSSICLVMYLNFVRAIGLVKMSTSERSVGVNITSMLSTIVFPLMKVMLQFYMLGSRM